MAQKLNPYLLALEQEKVDIARAREKRKSRETDFLGENIALRRADIGAQRTGQAVSLIGIFRTPLIMALIAFLIVGPFFFNFLKFLRGNTIWVSIGLIFLVFILLKRR